MSIADLRRKSKNNLAMLQAEIEKQEEKASGGGDSRFWKPTLDKSGNANFVIRFLPPPEGETLPWAQLYKHYFEGPNGDKYVENSLTTIRQPDPVGELNRKLWAEGEGSAGQEQARKQKRKLDFYSNILVIKDPVNPENEGKVFLYRYPKKIYDKIQACLKPAYADDPEFDPTDFWTGANFRLKIKTVGGYWNYDDSVFGPQTALSADDDELDAIYKQCYSLEAFTAPDQFKTYEELKARLDIVLGNVERPRATPAVSDEIDEELDWAAPAAPAPAPVASSSTEEEDAFSFFQNMASQSADF